MIYWVADYYIFQQNTTSLLCSVYIQSKLMVDNTYTSLIKQTWVILITSIAVSMGKCFPYFTSINFSSSIYAFQLGLMNEVF